VKFSSGVDFAETVVDSASCIVNVKVAKWLFLALWRQALTCNLIPNLPWVNPPPPEILAYARKPIQYNSIKVSAQAGTR
jgi:hypothetical protein